jgi:hypothetical protein
MFNQTKEQKMNKIQFIRMLVLFLLFFSVVACKINPDSFIGKSEILKLRIYEVKGVDHTVLLEPGSVEYAELIKWCRNNTHGWSPTYVTYVPHFYVSGKQFTLNFLVDGVVFNGPGGQYIKEFRPTELEFLQKMAGTEPMKKAGIEKHE